MTAPANRRLQPPDRKPGTGANHTEQQPGETAPRDQELDILGHCKRMKPRPQSVQMLGQRSAPATAIAFAQTRRVL